MFRNHDKYGEIVSLGGNQARAIENESFLGKSRGLASMPKCGTTTSDRVTVTSWHLRRLYEIQLLIAVDGKRFEAVSSSPNHITKPPSGFLLRFRFCCHRTRRPSPYHRRTLLHSIWRHERRPLCWILSPKLPPTPTTSPSNSRNLTPAGTCWKKKTRPNNVLEAGFSLESCQT